VAYTKTTFVNGSAPGISEAELNKIGTGIEDAHAVTDTVEIGATADQVITAGAGLVGGGTGDVTLAHEDTSAQASISNAPGTVIEDVTLDTYGHVTALGSRNLSPSDIGAAASAHSHGHDDLTVLTAYHVSSSAANIGTGITPLTKQLVMPSAGLVKLEWGFTIQLTDVYGAGPDAAATLKVLPRNDGSNMSTYFQVTDYQIGPLLTAVNDYFFISGVAFQDFAGADTSTWSIYVTKTSSATFSFVRGYLLVTAFPK